MSCNDTWLEDLRQELEASGSAGDKQKYAFAARVVAHAMKVLDIQVAASTEIGGAVVTDCSTIFKHENLQRTTGTQAGRFGISLQEAAKEEMGNMRLCSCINTHSHRYLTVYQEQSG